MAENTNLLVFRGQDANLVATYTTATDVTGFAFAFYVKHAYELLEEYLLSKTTGAGGITVLDAALGRIQVALTSADLQALPANQTYWYDLWRTDTGSNVVLAYGSLTVLPQARFDPPTPS